MSPISSGPQRIDRFISLDALRGIAVLLVVYDHLFAIQGERLAGRPFFPADLIRTYFSAPAGIIQDFGWLGVCLFFLVSGFVITRSAIEETLRTFAARRLLRVFPAFAAAILLVMALDLIRGHLRPPGEYLLALSLAGYVTVPQVIVIGVAWTLAIEIVFYVMMAVAAPLLKGRYPATGVLAILALITAIVARCRLHGDSFFLLAATVAYLPVLVFGVIAYLRHAQRISILGVTVLAFCALAAFIHGLTVIHTGFFRPENSYLSSVILAVAIFLVILPMRQAPRFLKFTGDISYSLYLLHGIIGELVIANLLPHFPPPLHPLAACLAVALSFLVSYAMYRGVEQPAITFAKRVTS